VKTRVLVVDDTVELLRAIVRGLARLGFSVEGSSSPEKALEMLSSGKYDIVVSDFQMGAMNGDDFCRKVRETSPTLPFILMSAHLSVYDVATACGASSALLKPVTQNDVRDAIHKLIPPPPTN
jgi:CheY-like chemotaxis protein